MKKLLILLISLLPLISFGQTGQLGANQIKKDGVTVKGNSLNQLQVDTSLIATKTYVNNSSVTTTGNTGDILYWSDTNVTSNLPIGTTQQVLTVNNGLPAWMPQQSGGYLVYYFQGTASDIATYYSQISTPYSPLTTLSTAGVTNGQVLRNYATATGYPNKTYLPQGLYQVNIHSAQTAGTKVIAIYCELWEVTSAGVDIALIGTTGNTTDLTGVNSDLFCTFSLSSIYNMASINSRIVTRVKAYVTGGGSAPTVAIYYGGTSDSRTQIPSNIVDATSFVPYTGATANVDLGSKNITTTGTGLLTSLSAIGATPNANGATVTNSVLNLEPASASFGGVVTTGTQTFAGAKTMTSPTFITDITTPIINGVSGALVFNNVAQASGAVTAYTFNIPTNTNQTASTEIPSFKISHGSKNWLAGAIATQRETYFTTTTYTAASASTITNAYGLYVEKATPSTNITITNNWGFGTDGAVDIGGFQRNYLTPATTTQPTGVNGSIPTDNKTALFLTATTTAFPSAKIGLQFGAYAKVYSIGGMFGLMTSDAGNTLGDLTWDMRSASGDASLTEVMRLKNNGNFLIGGATDNGYKLEVTGTAKVSTDITTPLIYGSTSASGTLTLQSTSNATKGKILFGTSAYDEVNNRLGIGTASPAVSIEVTAGHIRLSDGYSIGWANFNNRIYVSSNEMFFLQNAVQTLKLNATTTAFTPTGSVGTAITPFSVTFGASTNSTLSTEIPSFKIVGGSRQWATGAITTQRENLITAPTYSFVGASTITDAATLAVSGAPIAGTNATITNGYSIWAQAGDARFDGTNVKLKHLVGTTTAPTGAVGTGAGTSPSAVTFSTNATDLSGQVLVTTGTLPTAGATVLTVTFNTAYGTAPTIILMPANAATALLSGVTMVYTTSTTTTYVITAGSTGLVAATAYAWWYHVIQ